MIIANPFLCDRCGAKRQADANRWWLMWLEEWTIGKPQLNITAWNKEKAVLHVGVKHLCGQACVSVFVDCWLATGSLPVIELVTAVTTQTLVKGGR